MAERNNIIPRRCMKCGQVLIGKASVLRKHGRAAKAKANNDRIVREVAERKARMEKENLRS